MKVNESFTRSAYFEYKLKDKHILIILACLFELLILQLKKFIFMLALDNFYQDRQATSKNYNLKISRSRLNKLYSKKNIFFKSTYRMYSTLFTDKELAVMGLSSLHPYATTSEDEIKNFYAWFAGFTDAEGYFYIAISSSCAFRFQINLHKDDMHVLYFIQKNLGFGEVRSYNNYSSFTVTRLKDVKKLIVIFSQYPLQGSKWLNYKDFAKAFELYTNSRYAADSNLLKEILEIKNGMNKLRSDYTSLKEINITPYWLLGFIEGEGCFSINKGNSYRLDFSLTQAYSNLELMKKIKSYLENLPNAGGNYANALGISIIKYSNINHQSTVRIETTRIPYITNILIPFLENLTWHSKKQLDFQDWKIILMLKEKGHHFTEQGVNLIDRILNQMNNNRLSTNTKVLKSNVDRSLLLADIKDILNGPSNFEVKNGKKFIISLNKYYKSSRKNSSVEILDDIGNIIISFESLADCSAYLKVDPSTVSKRIKHNISFSLNNKQVYVKKSDK